MVREEKRAVKIPALPVSLGTGRIKDIAQARQRIGLATTYGGGKTKRVGGG
jgi:hypothetical protein